MLGLHAIAGAAISGNLTGTVTTSSPASDVSVANWTFTGVSLSSSINESVRQDSSYAEAPFSAGSAITTLSLPLSPGLYMVNFAAMYLPAATSGQFRFSALDSSNTPLGVSAWQAVTNSAALYSVSISVAGGTATRIKIEIQA